MMAVAMSCSWFVGFVPQWELGHQQHRRLSFLDDVSEWIRSSHAGRLQELHINGWHSGY